MSTRRLSPSRWARAEVSYVGFRGVRLSEGFQGLGLNIEYKVSCGARLQGQGRLGCVQGAPSKVASVVQSCRCDTQHCAASHV